MLYNTILDLSIQSFSAVSFDNNFYEATKYFKGNLN